MTSSYRRFAELTPSDTAVAVPMHAILVVGTGDVVVQDDRGVATTIVGVPAFTVLPLSPFRVLATGTTATPLIALTI